MPHDKTAPIDETKFILRGIHLDLTDALRRITMEKASRLLRHNAHILRIRIDLEHDKTRGAKDQFIAKGRIEISGPDLIASVHSDDAYKSVDALVDKLDALLRERHGRRKDSRNHPHAAELGAPLPKA